MKKSRIFGIIGASSLLLVGVSAYTIALNAQPKAKVARAATTATIDKISNIYGDQYFSVDLKPFDTTVYNHVSSVDKITKWVATDGVLTVETQHLNNFLIAHANGAGGNVVVGKAFHDKYVGNSGVENYGITYLNIDFYVGDDVLTSWKFGEPPAADTITVTPTSSELMVGNTLNIVANTSSTITWSSSDTNVAKVAEKQDDNKTGIVTGVAIGTATITARISETVAATCEITVIAHETIKLATPDGVSLNTIGDGGKLVAFAEVAHASSYKAVFHSQDDSSIVETAITNGGTIKPVWGNLVNGMTYKVGVIAVGDGYDYSNSDESSLSTQTYTCIKSGTTFAQMLLNATSVCDYNGLTFNITEEIWNGLKAKFDNVFYDERQSLKNKTTESEAEAIDRYNYILTKYSEDDYEWLKDFIGTNARTPSSSNNNMIMNIKETSSVVVITIICLSVVSFAGAATFLTLKKRKHQ